MQPDHKHRQGIDKALRRIFADIARKQCAVRQGELQLLSHEDRFKRVPLRVMPAGNYGNRFDCRKIKLFKASKEFILPFRNMHVDLFHCHNGIANTHEPHDMPGDTARQVDQEVFGPFGEGKVPRQGEHTRVRCCCSDCQSFRFCRRYGFPFRRRINECSACLHRRSIP